MERPPWEAPDRELRGDAKLALVTVEEVLALHAAEPDLALRGDAKLALVAVEVHQQRARAAAAQRQPRSHRPQPQATQPRRLAPISVTSPRSANAGCGHRRTGGRAAKLEDLPPGERIHSGRSATEAWAETA